MSTTKICQKETNNESEIIDHDIEAPLNSGSEICYICHEDKSMHTD